MTNNNNSGLAIYMAKQIHANKLKYDEVIAKYPQYKYAIDRTLSSLNAIPIVEDQ